MLQALLLCFFAPLVGAAIACGQIVPQVRPAKPAGRPSAEALRTQSPSKIAIERRFQSMHPKPLPALNAVPGRRLLDRADVRAAMLRQRLTAKAAAMPRAGSNVPETPGIALRPTQPGGEIPTSVITGDFNKDGKMDYVVANGETNDLWMYFGNGDGTFQLPRVVPLSKGVAPVYVVAGDLRGIGTLDLVVAEFDTATVGVLLNNGDGTFGYEQTYMLPNPPTALVVGDFNKDGKLDVVAAMTTVNDVPIQGFPLFALLTGDGSGALSAPVISYRAEYDAQPSGLDIGDINKDGLPDLLMTDEEGTGTDAYLNQGDGTFKLSQNVLAIGPFDIPLDAKLGDVNEDGCLDAVIGDLGTPVWIALGDCSGKFAQPAPFGMGDSSAAVRLADLNGDGHLDVVTSAIPGIGENFGESLGFAAGQSVMVALGDGKGNFSVARNYTGPGQATSLAVADFNGDGKPDVATANNDTDTTSVYLNDGLGGFGFPQGVYLGVKGDGVIDAPVSSPSFVDLNNDSKPDVVLLDAEEGGEYYLISMLNDGTGRFSDPVNVDLGINFVTNMLSDYRVGKFRDSLHEDFLTIQSPYDGTTPFILFAPGNGDGTFGKPVFTTTSGAQGLLAVGDFNGDGKLDFVAVNTGSADTLTTFLGNGDGTFRTGATITFDAESPEISRVFSADYNHDGKLDVMVFMTGNGYWTNSSSAWEFDGNGDGTFQAGREVETAFQPFTMADLNGDGQQDIARYDFFWPDSTSQTYGPAKFTNYLGQPDGTFTQVSTYAPYEGIPEEVYPYAQFGDPLATSLVADFNGDGHLDEAAFQFVQDGLPYAQFLQGNGDGTFVPNYDVYPFYIFGYPAFARDLDGDGLADMLELDSGVSALHVIKGKPASSLQIALNDEVVTGNASCGYVFPNLVSASSRTVTLSSSVAGVQLPASVTVPAGATNAEFCYTLAPSFDWHQVFDVTASLDGGSTTAYASDSYSLGFAEVVTPSALPPVYAGQATVPLTLTLTANPGYSSTVTLSCEFATSPTDTCRFGSTTLNVAPGAPVTTTVTVQTSANDGNATQLSFTVVATDANVVQRQTLNYATTMLSIEQYLNVPPTGAPGAISFPVQISGLPPYQTSCTGLPAGVTCALAGTPQAYPNATTYTANIGIPSGIAPGSYNFTLGTTSSGESASVGGTLDVLDFSLAAPPPISLLQGAVQSIDLTATGFGPVNVATFEITCSVDSGGTCTGGYFGISDTPSATPVTLSAAPNATVGSHTLTVVGSFSNGNGPFVSHTYSIPFAVTAEGGYTGALSATSVTTTPSSTVDVTLTLAPTGGFAGVVVLSCSVVSQVACTFSPSSSVTLTSPSVPVTIGLTTSASAEVKRPLREFLVGRLPVLATVLPFALWLGWGRKRRVPLLLMVVLGLALLSANGCGGGGTPVSGGGGGGSQPPSAYPITISGTIQGTQTTTNLGTVVVTVDH